MSPKDDNSLTWEDLPALFPGFAEPRRWLPVLQRHLELVEAAAAHTRVTAVAASQAVRRQYAESLEILRLALEHCAPERIADVGSGGGYPGLVIAAVLPGAEVALIEPLQKRARLLQAMARELGLDNVEVHALRAEAAGRGELRDAASLVTARAVAPLAELLEYTAPLAAPKAIIALPKGSGFDEELEAAGPAVAALACALEAAPAMRPEISANLLVALFRKTGPTPARYPRRAGLPGKRGISKD